MTSSPEHVPGAAPVVKTETHPDVEVKAVPDADAAVAAAPPVDDYPHGLRLFAVVFALLLSMFLVALDLTIVATAIPKITDEFKSLEDIGWYAAAFFITLAVFQMMWGRAYKHFDLKIVFLTTVLLFEVGSLICGVAQNSITLIVGRAIAGLGGAGVTGGIYTIIAFVVPPVKVPSYIGLVGAVFSVASVAGPLLGGVFTGEVTWRWAFYINLPIGGLSVALILLFFRVPSAVKPIPIERMELLKVADLPSILLSLGFSICFTLFCQYGGTTDPWNSGVVIGNIVAFVVMLLMFSAWQHFAGERAMIVPRFIRQWTIAGLCLYIFFLNATNLGILYNLPQYFQVIKGTTPTMSGIHNLPMIFSTAFTALPSGAVLGKHPTHFRLFLIAGGAVMAVGAGLVYTFDQDTSIGKIIGYQILVGAGVGWSIQVPVTVAQRMCDPQDIAVVTAVVLFFQLITGAIWVASAQAVLTNRLIAALGRLAPHLNPHQVLTLGAVEIRETFTGGDLEAVLASYMIGLKESWILSATLAGLTFLSAFVGEWKAKKPAAVERKRSDAGDTSSGTEGPK